jgi:hypothetical protein
MEAVVFHEHIVGIGRVGGVDEGVIVGETKVESSMMGDLDAGDVEWRFWGALPCAGSSKVAANSVREVVGMICKVVATGSGVYVFEFDLSSFGEAV